MCSKCGDTGMVAIGNGVRGIKQCDCNYTKSEIIERISISIFEENEVGKVDKKVIETDSLLGVARFLGTYKSKKGKRVVHIGVDVVEVLV